LGYFNQPEAMAVSPDGSAVFLTGVVDNRRSAGYDGTVAYSAATGVKLWSAIYPGGAGYALAVSPDSATLYVTGGAGTLAYNAATGAVRWTDPSVVGTSVAISPDGSTLFVTDWTNAGAYVTGAYTAATGTSLWTASYAHPLLTDGPGIAVSPDGTTVYVWGGQDNNKFATLAYNAATGALRWASYYRSASGDTIPTSLAVSPDGSAVYLTGDSSTSTQELNYITVAYNAATGARLWVRGYNDAVNGDDTASSVTVSPDGSAVYVTGQGMGRSGYYDYATLAYNATTGATLWATRYNVPGQPAGAIFAGLSPGGSTLYVTGQVGYGYGTVAYDAATGTRLWVRTYTALNSAAITAAVNPVSPQVVVSGTGDGGTSGRQKYVTVSYRG
jgi:outer membrane protein assembly factor BamB